MSLKRFLPLLFLLSACSKEILTVHTDYLSRENLASAHVHTPDPLYENPPVGQKLIISWTIPKGLWELGDVFLAADVRFKNREQNHYECRVLKRQGVFVVELLNEDYFTKEGIRTYRIQLVQNGQLIDDWTHQLFVDWIQIGTDTVGEELDLTLPSP